MKIALAQINTTVADFEKNTAKIREFAMKAYSQGAQLVVFPEMAICGYPVRDMVQDPAFVGRNIQALTALATELPTNLFVLVGAVTNGTPKPYNSAVLMHNGSIQRIQNKVLLPTYDVFDEWRNFAAGENPRLMNIQKVPLGITVCEDMWNNHKFWLDRKQKDPYAVDPVEQLVIQGAELIINISASPFHMGKHKTRLELLKDIATFHQTPIVWVNSVGGNDHLVFDGNSCVVDARGDVVAQAYSFQEDLVYFDTKTNQGTTRYDCPMADEMEELYSALKLGLQDYVHKCGFSKVVIGLSGGIDSAVTAAIAADALGAENVTGITMPSKYSSGGSVDDSVLLARGLGIKLYQVPIQSAKETLIGSIRLGEQYVPPVLGNPQGGFKLDDNGALNVTGLADENMQARLRGLILMTYSNQTGALVLSTGNKSELAVGYCTLYGDMCGGLAVISDVPKTKVYELAKWINSHIIYTYWNGKKGGHAIPEATITKPPSAELAPGQVDQDSLPPYEVLDAILEAYVEDFKDPDTIVASLSLDAATVYRVCAMIDRNEYKRQQATIGLKVTEKAFGVGRRYPVAKHQMYAHKAWELNQPKTKAEKAS